VSRALLLALLILASRQTSAQVSTFVYQGWLNENETFEIVPPATDRQGEIVIGGDAYFKSVYFCAPPDLFACVIGHQFYFAVPRDLGAQGQWEFRDRRYEVADRGISITLFGRQLSGLTLIKTPPAAEFSYRPGEQQFNFLYSPGSGLVAFSWTRSHAERVFWLRGTVGFGSRVP
jgi:hypothetical protein